MAAQPLTPAELDRDLADLPGWTHAEGALVRTFTAPDFLTGIAIVDAVARVAEGANHHPDIDIRWRRVRFALSTHDAGNAVTAKDVELAHTIDRIAADSGAE